MRERFLRFLSHWSIPALRVSLAVVYIWFGALKLAGESPVAELVQNLYPFLPEPMFLNMLGVWEVLIGLGLLVNRFLWPTLVLLWLQMGGIMLGLLVGPALFFQEGNPLLLTLDGEFLIKNLVLIAASLVVAGHELLPRNVAKHEAALGEARERS